MLSSAIRLSLVESGALGLDLTAASLVFFLDPWWNSSMEDQAIDRVHRLGQVRPVKVFQIIIQVNCLFTYNCCAFV